MTRRNRGGALTSQEKRVVKALIQEGMRLQDIQALVNLGRKATVNSARLTETRYNPNIIAAPEEEVAFFRLKKESYDPQTGLNLFDDERLIRAREAMMLAVHLFNSPTLKFKSEVFAVLANIAWTYLLHEFYARRGVEIIASDGNALLLSQMLKRADCPLSKGIKNNLESIKAIRDTVEHQILARSDNKWLGIFQACCLNFDKTLCTHFGTKASLQNDLAFSLQFSKFDFDQVVTLQKYEVPELIEALDARLKAGLTEDELGDLEYQFRVVYTFDNASKGRAHIQFLTPDSPEADQVRKVLVKYKPSDEMYPHKPLAVAKLVSKKSGKRFTSNDHVKAWQKHKVRPVTDAKNPQNTNADYCIYHPAHKDYTYSEKWVDFLVQEIAGKSRST